MEFGNEHFLKLKEKKKIAMKNAQSFYALSSEFMSVNKKISYSLYRRAERILWYEPQKLDTELTS